MSRIRSEKTVGNDRSDKVRTERFMVRLTPDERDALFSVAEAEHLTPSAWLRRAAILARKAAR